MSAEKNILMDTEPGLPRFGYHLLEYKGIQIITFAPVSVGDYILVKEGDDARPTERRVTRITHMETTGNVGTSACSAFVSFED